MRNEVPSLIAVWPLLSGDYNPGPVQLSDKQAALPVSNIDMQTWPLHCGDLTHGTAVRNASMLHADPGQRKLWGIIRER